MFILLHFLFKWHTFHPMYNSNGINGMFKQIVLCTFMLLQFYVTPTTLSVLYLRYPPFKFLPLISFSCSFRTTFLKYFSSVSHVIILRQYITCRRRHTLKVPLNISTLNDASGNHLRVLPVYIGRNHVYEMHTCSIANSLIVMY